MAPFAYQHDFNTIQIIGKYNKHPIAHCMNVIYILVPSRWASHFFCCWCCYCERDIYRIYFGRYLLYSHKFKSAAKSFISWITENKLLATFYTASNAVACRFSCCVSLCLLVFFSLLLLSLFFVILFIVNSMMTSTLSLLLILFPHEIEKYHKI